MSDAIVISNVKKNYGSVQALRGVSLNIPTGGIYGLIGPNGAGKTTLFSTVLGYIQPTEGSVHVLGALPRDLFRQQGKIAALPQDADMPPTLTVHETLRFFGRLAGIEASALSGEIDRVLKVVDLATWSKARLGTLSHGMKKRVFIAQALLGSPELIVLDEPTAGLDPKHAYELGQIFKAQKATVVISSHNLNELEHLCDRAAILVKGEVVRSGTMDEIRNADQEVHIALVAGFDNTGFSLPGVTTSYDSDAHRLTLRFTTTSERSAEKVTTEALQALIAKGALIREVERGQSLLQTYLQLS